MTVDVTTDWMYRYRAEIVRVIDGDTVILKIDLGFHLTFEQRVRFYGVNAPELRTDEGKLAKTELETAFPVGAKVIFESYRDKPDKYGRLLGNIYAA